MLHKWKTIFGTDIWIDPKSIQAVSPIQTDNCCDLYLREKVSRVVGDVEDVIKKINLQLAFGAKIQDLQLHLEEELSSDEKQRTLNLLKDMALE